MQSLAERHLAKSFARAPCHLQRLLKAPSTSAARGSTCLRRQARGSKGKPTWRCKNHEKILQNLIPKTIHPQNDVRPCRHAENLHGNKSQPRRSVQQAIRANMRCIASLRKTMDVRARRAPRAALRVGAPCGSAHLQLTLVLVHVREDFLHERHILFNNLFGHSDFGIKLACRHLHKAFKSCLHTLWTQLQVRRATYRS